MKRLGFLALVLMNSSAFAAVGTVMVEPNRAVENMLGLTIQGDAAQDISAQLTKNGVEFRIDRFSGAKVQRGNGVRCIDQHQGRPLYCYLSITGSKVDVR
jgi:hypothetical protein